LLAFFRNKTIEREDKENTENILPLQDEMDEMQHFLFAQSCEQGLYDDGNHVLMNLDENSKVRGAFFAFSVSISEMNVLSIALSIFSHNAVKCSFNVVLFHIVAITCAHVDLLLLSDVP